MCIRTIIKSQGPWISPPASLNMIPATFTGKKRKHRTKLNQFSCLIPRLLLVFSQRLEILVTALIRKDSNIKVEHNLKEQYGRSLNGLDIPIGDLYS